MFDSNPLQYHAFMKSFENGVECKPNSFRDRLYFFEQYTRGHPREIVRGYQHTDSDIQLLIGTNVPTVMEPLLRDSQCPFRI